VIGKSAAVDDLVVQTLVSCSIAAQHDDLSAEARGAKADDVYARQSSTTTRGWLQAHAANAVAAAIDGPRLATVRVNIRRQLEMERVQESRRRRRWLRAKIRCLLQY